jgi:glycosyltransferase involved in cell wall biosynthesis
MNTKHGSNLSIVVPLYVPHVQVIPIIQDFFNSLSLHYPEAQVIVIDDCSPVDHPFSATHRNSENLGFSGNVNVGLAFATNDILIVANDDLIINQGDLDGFIVMDSDDLWIYSPLDSASSSDNSFGCLWGMSRTTYKLLGGLDTRCKHYFSDKLYYKKAIDSGVKIIKDTSIVVTHKESSTYNLIDKSDLFDKDLETYSVLLNDGNSI